MSLIHNCIWNGNQGTGQILRIETPNPEWRPGIKPMPVRADPLGSAQLSTCSLHFESVDLVIADVRARALRIDVQAGWYHVLNRGSKDARSFSTSQRNDAG